ncbi:unnamed protein product [Wuchereria bancrofti]|uniref:Uncharacterized protein n=1 Tax=Wuchereria bancrofti TaxID=6293 RepID=A0A3P7DTD1_WUCBA|nr:unnamed protein product [Wuchereria bancrofti]
MRENNGFRNILRTFPAQSMSLEAATEKVANSPANIAMEQVKYMYSMKRSSYFDLISTGDDTIDYFPRWAGYFGSKMLLKSHYD